jgi:hypothetical protein
LPDFPGALPLCRAQTTPNQVLPQHAHLAASGQDVREVHRRDGFEADSANNIFKSTALAAAAAQQQGVL